MCAVDDLVVTIPGRPVSWKRAKKHGKRHYTDAAMDDHANHIAARVMMAARKAGVKRLPVCVQLDVVAIWARPKKPAEGHPCRDREGRVPRHHVPDADNVAKLVMDALGRTRLWSDDAQVTDLRSRKRWAAHGERAPRTDVVIREDSGDES